MELSIRLRNKIEEGNPNVFKASCTIRKEHIRNAYVDPYSKMNAISLSLYNKLFAKRLNYEGFNFVGALGGHQLWLEDSCTTLI